LSPLLFGTPAVLRRRFRGGEGGAGIVSPAD
jgi:hypothetical protein